jgi:pSer/pThr/pTyr-binding forkhead associated (FHA) protein
MVLPLPAVAADAPARDVMLVIDLPADSREPNVLIEAVAKLAGSLPVGSRFGAVAVDAQGASLVAALADPAVARETIADAVPALVAVADKDPAAALERALYELRIEGRNEALPAVVLVSDGRTLLAGDGTAERRAWMLGPLTEEAVRNQAPVYVVALSKGADMSLLQPLARATGADYFRAESAAQIAEAMAKAGAALVTAVPRPTSAEAGPTPATPAARPASAEVSPTSAAPAPPMPVADVAVIHPAPDADILAGRILAGVVGAGVALAAVAAVAVARRRRAVVPGPDNSEAAGNAQAKTAPPVAPVAFLNDLRGTTQFSRYALGTRPVVIGRSPGKDTRNFDYITVTLNTVSRRHAVIEYRDGAYWLIDQGSVNGTKVNDKRIQGARRLCHGDRIALHRCELQFEIAEGSRDQPAVAAASDTHAPTHSMTTQPGRRAALLSETVVLPGVTTVSQPSAKVATQTRKAARGNRDARTVAVRDDGAESARASASLVGDSTPPGASAASVAGALDSFISTTLLQASNADQSLPAVPPPKPTEPVHLFAALDTASREMSIEDFLGSDIESDQPASSAPSPVLLATQPLSDAVPQAGHDARSGDTIKLALDDSAHADATTTSLEELLRAFETQRGSDRTPRPGRSGTGSGGEPGRES